MGHSIHVDKDIPIYPIKSLAKTYPMRSTHLFHKSSKYSLVLGFVYYGSTRGVKEKLIYMMHLEVVVFLIRLILFAGNKKE